MTRAILAGDPNYLESEAGLAWHLQTSPPAAANWYLVLDHSIAFPEEDENLPSQAFKRIQIYPGLDVSTQPSSLKLGIRFLCTDDPSITTPYTVINNFNLGNTNPLSASVVGKMKIEGIDGAQFKIGNFPNNFSQREITLNGNVNWQASETYSDIGFDVDAGGVVYEYNPCHPVYGLWQLLLDENGDPSQSVEFTFGNVGDLLASNIIQDWIDDVTGGGELTEEQNDALEAGLTEALTDLILSGGTLSCPNINYTVSPG